MLPQSQEDIIKIRIYKELGNDGKVRDISEYVRECRIRCEESRHSKTRFRLFKSYSLDEGLFNLAFEYGNTDDRKARKKINRKAYNLITRCKSPKINPTLMKHYYQMYREMRRGFSDLMKGIAYIGGSLEDLEVD